MITGKARQVLVYLGLPGAHEDDMDTRLKKVNTASAVEQTLISDGLLVFNPMSYLIRHGFGEALLGEEEWRDYRVNMLRKCDALIVFAVDGWEGSEETRSLIEYADSVGMPRVEIEEWTPFREVVTTLRGLAPQSR